MAQLIRMKETSASSPRISRSIGPKTHSAKWDGNDPNHASLSGRGALGSTILEAGARGGGGGGGGRGGGGGARGWGRRPPHRKPVGGGGGGGRGERASTRPDREGTP